MARKYQTGRERRERRHRRIRKGIVGTSERPRLAVFRSLNHIYAQVIDESGAQTLVAASTLDKELDGASLQGGNQEAAKRVGTLVAERALAKGVRKVSFDRGGYSYHGRIKALADAARAQGLEF